MSKTGCLMMSAQQQIRGHVSTTASVSNDNVTSLIMEAVTDCRRWSAVLDHLRLELDVTGAALGEFDFATRTGSIKHCAGYDLDYVRLYAERYVTRNPWFPPPSRASESDRYCREEAKRSYPWRICSPPGSTSIGSSRNDSFTACAR